MSTGWAEALHVPRKEHTDASPPPQKAEDRPTPLDTSFLDGEAQKDAYTHEPGPPMAVLQHVPSLSDSVNKNTPNHQRIAPTVVIGCLEAEHARLA
jgi:hypothetical protein